jgi:hypothetical protein
VLIAATVFIAAAFLVVAGPAVLRIHPLERAVGASAALGIFVAIVASCCAARRPSAQASGLEMLSSTPSSSKSHGTGAPLWGPPEGTATESDSEPEGSPVKKTSSHPGGLDVVGFLGGLLCRTNKEPPPDRDLILRVRDGGSGSIRHLAERYGDKAAGMGHLAREDVEGGASGEGVDVHEKRGARDGECGWWAVVLVGEGSRLLRDDQGRWWCWWWHFETGGHSSWRVRDRRARCHSEGVQRDDGRRNSSFLAGLRHESHIREAPP